jgi:hypothetical protein
MSSPGVVIFNDMVSNGTYPAFWSLGTSGGKKTAVQLTYFEGTNIYVYIRGSQDDDGPWWSSHDTRRSLKGSKGITMVNAHYDS